MTLRTLAFGDLHNGIWGTVWDLGEGQPRFALLGGANASKSPAGIDGSGLDDTWTVSAPDVSVACEAVGEPSALAGGFDQLVRVRGRLGLDGSAQEVDCLGRRGRRDSIDPARFESIRDVSCWFEPDLGFAVSAARPDGAASHAEDLVSASAFEEGRSLRVLDPRLSTTYAATGEPARASFELWLERQEPAPGDAEAARDQEELGDSDPYPRRAAGESVGAHGAAVEGFLNARAELFRWHARGREGAGVYVLARLVSG